MGSVRTALTTITLTISLSACTAPPEPPPLMGALAATLEVARGHHDVTAVRIDIVEGDGACDAAVVATETIAVAGSLPAALAPAGSGAHAFGDGLFLLPPGPYRACAAPLAGDAPSADCAPADATATVTAGETGRVLLVSQCKGAATGGLDVGVALNDPPRITDLSVTPSKFITVCQAAKLTVEAQDPDGDALDHRWSVVSGPEGGRLTGGGPSVVFSGGAAGTFVVAVSVTDVHGASASVTFPISVADAECAVPEAVQAVFTHSCAPCHTVGASGGLKLDSAVTSFANLVGKAAGSTCQDRTRVIPGDAAGSYLVAKLRGLPGICGVPMPRGRPALSEADLAIVEGWIASLAP